MKCPSKNGFMKQPVSNGHNSIYIEFKEMFLDMWAGGGDFRTQFLYAYFDSKE